MHRSGTTSLLFTKPEEGIHKLLGELQTLLVRNSVSNPRPRPAACQLPEGEYFSDYPLRLEQLLAIRCPGIDGVPLSFLTGEREILDGNLRLCAGCPQNVTVRIVLAQTLLAMNRIRPEVVQEFRDEI